MATASADKHTPPTVQSAELVQAGWLAKAGSQGNSRRTSSVLLDLRKNSASTVQFSLLIDRFRRHSETNLLPWLPTKALHRAVTSYHDAECGASGRARLRDISMKMRRDRCCFSGG